MQPTVERGEPRIPERRPQPWGALLYRDYRLLFSGQLVSQLGTWMQFTALGYYVASLAPEPPEFIDGFVWTVPPPISAGRTRFGAATRDDAAIHQ